MSVLVIFPDIYSTLVALADADVHILEEWTIGFVGGLRSPSALLVFS